MADMSGKVVVVTGAAGGFGNAFTSAFLSAGASVGAIDVSEAGLSALSEHHRGVNADRLMTRVADIADFASVEASVGAIAERYGGIDILINNAGMGMSPLRTDHMVNLVGIDEITPEFWDQMVAVNLTGPWNMTKASIDFLRRSGGGRIINVTTSFFTMLRSRFHPYGPSKSGFESMSAGHAGEFAGDGVTVNVVVPGGPADTPMVPEDAGFDRDELIRPEAMTWPTLWLCSPEADGITGNRYVAGLWDPTLTPQENRAVCESPIGWPDLAGSPVWPGGRPSE